MMAVSKSAPVNQGSLEKKNGLFSGIDRSLLTTRMPGVEGLAEALLVSAPDERVPDIAYVLHDWFTINRPRGFEKIVKYFDQDKVQIDCAVSLFIQNRQAVCNPKNLKPGQHPLLQLYLLFDCLIQAGSLKRRARTVGYLSTKKKPIKYMNASDFLRNAKDGQVYNYVIVDGKERIADKRYFHSEVASGDAVEASGESCLKRSPDGHIRSIILSDFSGHYRIADSAFKMGDIFNRTLNAEPSFSSSRPDVFLTHDSLLLHLRR